MNEVWKPVAGYEGLYEISNYGRIKSNYTKREILKPAISRWGYLRLTLCKNGKRKNESIHRLVALAFIPNPQNKPVTNHLDENKLNNNVSNLEWATYAENNNYGTARKRSIENTDMKAKAEKSKKPIVQLNESGETIRNWGSSADACRALGINSSVITSCCKHKPKRKSAGGFRWEYSSTIQ